jgi:RNA polymerase sigma factor (TIGR02999 family)
LSSPTPVTEYLRGWNRNDREAIGVVIESLYSELHRIAARMLGTERSDHTLQPSALINELYLRLHACTPPEWRNRAHFLAVAANTLRRILIDHARAHRAQQRGGGKAGAPLHMADAGAPCSYDDLLIVDEALRELERADPRAARVTELRFFGGLLECEIAEELGISEITVKRDWKFARAWLASHFGGNSVEPSR